MKHKNPIDLIFLVILSFTFMACDGLSNSDSDTTETGIGLWSDSPSVTSNIDLESDPASPGITYRYSTNRVETTTDKIHFRSSDIEFWSISTENDLNSIFSNKYNISNDYTVGRSLEYCLGDDSESVTFSPYHDNTVSLGNGLNPNWNSETVGFINSGKTVINLARLDIGAGQVTFFLDEEVRNVFSADGNDGNGINANSILFIDEQFLKRPVLITRDLETDINNNSITADDLEITEQEFSFIQKLFHNNNTVDTETMIDVNGALCLPLSPVDISSFDPENNTLRIKILWDIAGAIHLRDDEYFMDNRVKNTAFDFTVAITIE